MRKTVMLLAAACVCAVSFAAGKREHAPVAPEVRLTAPGELPVVRERVTLTGFIPSIGHIDDTRTNAAIRQIEKRTNIAIEWIESTKVDARNKLSVLLASGDHPDFIQGAAGYGLSGQDLFRYGAQGVFIPLNDLIDQQGYYIKELFTAEPHTLGAITSADGRIYGLPAVSTDDYHMEMRQKLWINTEWLERLGLGVPTTTEELYRTLKLFKERDANGNGDPNDEIPLTGAKRNLEDLTMWIMNAFVPAGGQDDSGDALLNNYEFIVDGKLFFSADKPEFREGLRFVRKLYLEGLFDVTALTQDKEQIKPLVDGDDASRIGAVASHHPGNFASLSDAEDARYRQYAALPPIAGPSGHRATPWFADAVIVPGQFVITNHCEYPEVAFRYADYCYSLEFGLLDKGIRGVHWDFANPAERLVGLNGLPAKYKYLKVLTPEDNAQINLGPVWTRDLKNEFASGTGAQYEEMLYRQTKLYDPYKVPRYPYAVTPIAEQDIAEFNDLRRTIHTFIGESVDRFIIGDLDLDTQWDAYVRQLNQIGLPRFLVILETSYSKPRQTGL
jgi:putative aldouronate transport system substrate-binding protein